MLKLFIHVVCYNGFYIGCIHLAACTGYFFLGADAFVQAPFGAAVNCAESIATKGNIPRVPYNATDQPDIDSHFLKGSCFWLPPQFSGAKKEMVKEVKKFFEDICGETKLSYGRGLKLHLVCFVSIPKFF